MTPAPAPGALTRRIQEREPQKPAKPEPWMPEWRRRLVAKDMTGRLS